MHTRRILLTSAFVALMSACGSDERASPAVSQTSAAVSSTIAVAPTAPATGLFDPASWVGHTFTESMMAAPFAEVSLDGAPTGWVSAADGCGMMDGPLPPACIAFVRPDPGGYGHSIAEPSAWMVLSWQVDPTNYTLGGPVLDAVSVVIDDPELMPEGQCRSVSDQPGVYSAFIRYDPTYLPAPDATAVTPEDIAAHPVVVAWTLDADQQIVQVPADTVECVLYSYGD
jgi:hypothetical protein